jgi:cell division protein FtsB
MFKRIKKALRKIDAKKVFQKIWANKKLTAFLVVSIAAILFALFSTRGVLQRVRLEREKSEWKRKIEDARAEQDRLKKLSRDLDTSQRAIEKVAREEYGMIKPGEKVYRVRKENK